MRGVIEIRIHYSAFEDLCRPVASERNGADLPAGFFEQCEDSWNEPALHCYFLDQLDEAACCARDSDRKVHSPATGRLNTLI